MKPSLPERLLGLLGYPSPPDYWQKLGRLRHAICKAAAEVLYPVGDESWPSYEDAEMLPPLHDFLVSLPPRKRKQITFLLVCFEFGALFVWPFRRFSQRRVTDRTRYLEAWEGSRFYWLRMGFSSLRILLNMPYLSSPVVRKRVGDQPSTECRSGDYSPPDMSDGVIEYPQLTGRQVKDEVDFVVVGSGPGGSVVARELAEAGRSVVVIEEGPRFRPDTYEGSPYELMRDVFRERGLRAAAGNIMVPTMQAKVLGGCSVVNSAICWRAPAWLFDRWRTDFGVEGISLDTLTPSYERAERNASVVPTGAEVLGRKGELFMKGCAASGAVGRPANRATKDCRGCSECMLGCRVGAKQNMDRCYIPAAVQLGARFYTSCRAEDLIVEKGRVAGVRGYVLDPDTGERTGQVTVRAKATILSAGVMASPLILLKNELPYKSPAIGRNLAFHPGIGAFGVFAEDVNPWVGATQGADTDSYVDDGIHMEVLWVPTALIAARLAGWGQAFWGRLADMKQSAVWCASVCGSSRGRLTARDDWDPRLRFHLNQADVGRLHRAIGLLAEHFLAAGATTVRPGVHGFDQEIRSEADLKRLRAVNLTAQQIMVVSNHVFGTCSMGADPRTSVVGSDFGVHNVPDLYVCDTSVFPSPSAVNPQLTLMALADQLAHRLAGRY